MATASSGSVQGEVTVYHFPGLLGAIGIGWGGLRRRFLVLEHGVVLLYASEADWAEHHEPLDELELSADSTVDLNTVKATTQEGKGGEVLVRLRCPNHPPLSFRGSRVLFPYDTDGDTNCNSVGSHIHTTGPSSEAWRKAIRREIAKLRREAGAGAQQAVAVTESVGRGGFWRLWRGVRAVVGRGTAAARPGVNADPAAEETSEDDEDEDDGLIDVDVGLSYEEEQGDEKEEGKGEGKGEGERDGNRGRKATEEGGDGSVGGDVDDAGGGKLDNASFRREKITITMGGSGSVRFRRWPIKRGGSHRHIPEYDSAGHLALPSTTQAAAGGEGIGNGIGDGYRDTDRDRDRDSTRASSRWSKVSAVVRQKDSGANSGSTWHRDGGIGRSHRQQPSTKLGRKCSNRYRRECSWSRKRVRASVREEDTSPVVDRWEFLVGRWVPLQMARSGDTVGVKSFLEEFPAFPDKENLLRAAVRYKQYSLVEYFLEEQHMDVNLKNAVGMPLVWFSVAFMQRGDSGVMLRYLIQKGADIHLRSSVGQTVLFLLVSSRGKEAIPMLKYLVEECGLSLSHRDDFGSQPLHWAVLYGHLDTVQWICRYTRYIAARANWSKAFERMKQIRLVRPEHMGAARSWRMRGLQKSARSLTPLGVAVLHNHELIAKWLMGYGTAEGEEAMGLSCRRVKLFSEENRDLALVAKTWPELLPEVLRGFERKNFRPRNSFDTDEKRPVAPTGWSERTYDFKLLYGLPEVPPSRSALSILLRTDCARLFEVKVVQMVVALKWSVFGQRYYLWEVGRFLLLSASFIIGFVIWAESPNWIGHIDVDEDIVWVVGGTVSRVICWALTLYNLLVEEGRELNASKSVKKYLEGGWNLQSVAAYVLVLALIPMFQPWTESRDWVTDEQGYTMACIVRRSTTAPAALFLFTRLMEHLAVWRSTGIFIAVIRTVIADTASWSVLFILFEAAFALAFYALLQGNPGYETVWESMVTVFALSVGEINLPFSENMTLHVVAVLMFVLFMLIVAIVYLNLLVAMMTSGYTEVVQEATAQAMMNRAAALVKWEGIMHPCRRLQAFQMVAPGKGKHSKIILKGWFGGADTEVFCSEEGATAVEPEQSSSGKRVDTHEAVMRELQAIRDMVNRASAPGVRGFSRVPPAGGGGEGESFNTSSDDRDSSFRQRQAGMLDVEGKGLSGLRLGGDGSSPGGDEGGKAEGMRRRDSASSVTSEDLQEWRKKAREVQEQANSRRGVIRTQAVIRGYLLRSKSEARFLPDNKDGGDDGDDGDDGE